MRSEMKGERTAVTCPVQTNFSDCVYSELPRVDIFMAPSQK